MSVRPTTATQQQMTCNNRDWSERKSAIQWIKRVCHGEWGGTPYIVVHAHMVQSKYTYTVMTIIDIWVPRVVYSCLIYIYADL